MSLENSQILDILKLIDKLDARLRKLEEKIPDTFDVYYKAPGENKHKKLHLSLDELYAKINRVEEMLGEE